MLNEWNSAKKLGDCRGTPKPAMYIPKKHAVKHGILASTFRNCILATERALTEADFNSFIQRPLKEALADTRVKLQTTGEIEEMLRMNPGWLEYIKVQEERVGSHATIKTGKKSRQTRKAKEANMSHMDIPMKDWAILTVIFPEFEQGPNVFWKKARPMFDDTTFNTMFLLLEMNTIKYLARGKVGMDTIGKNEDRSTSEDDEVDQGTNPIGRGRGVSG